MTPTRLGDKLPYYRFRGLDTCKYLKKDITEVLYEVTKSIILDFPGTEPFIFGNACARTGRCPGNDSHVTMSEVDGDYPTNSGLGTQYGRWTPETHESIWDGDTLLEDKINWRALHQFWIRLKSYCVDDKGKYQFITNDKIFELVARNVSAQERAYLNRIMTLDYDNKRNHRTHGHYKICLK